tara:strand:+ start:443 stop:664 length:222 start_codon:yes stop_codon:yes gene_type:complete
MKGFLELPICKERYLKKPTTEMVGDEIVNTWSYQSISWSCQGDWNSVVFTYKKNEYDFNNAIEELTKFIEKNS